MYIYIYVLQYIIVYYIILCKYVYVFIYHVIVYYHRPPANLVALEYSGV